ncbi:conserved hypothetical protein [Vibrio chagasii]|nr:conserved hypothetical protein [Vibrio chagasii]CAH6907936.1 conserved hypothetical protein [Vibrio chagasii]CAH7177776.1 conserved hypothetical protein [Vibrio chagasii]
MIIDISSNQEIEESLDQILWDDFSFQYVANKTTVIDQPLVHHLKSNDDNEEHKTEVELLH